MTGPWLHVGCPRKKTPLAKLFWSLGMNSDVVSGGEKKCTLLTNWLWKAACCMSHLFLPVREDRMVLISHQGGHMGCRPARFMRCHLRTGVCDNWQLLPPHPPRLSAIMATHTPCCGWGGTGMEFWKQCLPRPTFSLMGKSVRIEFRQLSRPLQTQQVP